MPSRALGALVLALALLVPRTGPAGTLHAQRGVISGRVVDAQSALPLADATVTLEPRPLGSLPSAPRGGSGFAQAGRSTRTDSTGAYLFAGITEGEYRLHVQRLGYRSSTVEVELRGPAESRVSVGLDVEPVALQPIEVSTSAVDAASAYGRPGLQAARGEGEGWRRVAVEELRQRLYLSSDVRAVTSSDLVEGITLGETDLFRALQRLPGVGARDEYSAELLTRGGPWDQTRVYFDGLPLFNPVHALGTFSGVSPDAVGAAFFHPGVAPTALGGGAVGSLDLRTRSGGQYGKLSGAGELSLISGRLALDGTMGKDERHSWMVAGRRTYLDWVTRAVEHASGAEDVHFPYDFSDVTSRYDYRIGGDGVLEVSTLLQQDRISGDLPDVLHGTRAEWGSVAARATLDLPVRGLRARTTLGASVFDSEVSRAERDPAVDSMYSAPEASESRNAVEYVTLSGQVAPASRSAAPSPWSAGYELVLQNGSYAGPFPGPAMSPIVAESHVGYRSRLRHGALWGERRWDPTAGLTVETGLRVEVGGAVQDAGAVRLAPRLSARYRVSPSLSLSAGAGRAYQYAQAVAPAATPLLKGFEKEYLWVLAGDTTPALRSDIATLGAEAWLGPNWLGALTGYVRSSSGVAIPDPQPGSALGRPLYVAGENRAHGAEVSVRKLAGRWTASAAYSYGVSEMQAEGLRFPAAADQRHALDATAMVRLGRWQLGGAYTFGSGLPYTRTFSGSVDCYQKPECVWADEPWVGEPGARRTGAFQSLDLLADWSGSVRGWKVGAYLQVRNALNHENPGRYTGFNPWYCAQSCGTANGVDFGWEGRDSFTPGLPTLPVLGFRVAF